MERTNILALAVILATPAFAQDNHPALTRYDGDPNMPAGISYKAFLSGLAWEQENSERTVGHYLLDMWTLPHNELYTRATDRAATMFLRAHERLTAENRRVEYKLLCDPIPRTDALAIRALNAVDPARVAVADRAYQTALARLDDELADEFIRYIGFSKSNISYVSTDSAEATPEQRASHIQNRCSSLAAEGVTE